MHSHSSNSNERPSDRQSVPMERVIALQSPIHTPRPNISPSRAAGNASRVAALTTPLLTGPASGVKPKMSLDEYMRQLAGSSPRKPILSEQRDPATPSAAQPSSVVLPADQSRFASLCEQREQQDRAGNKSRASPLKQRRVVQDYESSEDDEWIKSLGSRVFQQSLKHPPRKQYDAYSSDSSAGEADASPMRHHASSSKPRGATSRSEGGGYFTAGAKKRRLTSREERATCRKPASPQRQHHENSSSGVDLLASEDERQPPTYNESQHNASEQDNNDENFSAEPYPCFQFGETNENRRISLGYARGRIGYIPGAIARYLRPYQIKGVQWLWKNYASSKRNGGILADDMGLGKTVQIIAFLAAVLGKQGIDADKKRVRDRRRGLQAGVNSNYPMLIVCPSSVLTQWHEHLSAWGHFSLSALQGDSEEKSDVVQRVKQGRVEILLTSYDMLRRYDVALREVRWHVAVFDEFHLLKNPNAAATVSARMLSVDFRVGLTGTPIQNNLEELWCLLNVLVPRRFLDKKEWKAHFSNPIKRAQKKSASEDAVQRGRQRQKELKKLLSAYMLCRTKSVIEHELKGKDDIIVFCELSELQKTIYKHLLCLPDFHNARYHRRRKHCGCSPQPCQHKLPMLPDGSGLDERAVLWLRTHDDHQQGCRRCPTCVVFSCLAVLQKVANHPFLLQVDELDPNADRRDFIHEFAQKALGPEIMAQMGGPIRSQKFTEVTRADISGKMETLSKLLERFHSKGDKVLLFSFSTQMLDLLQAYMKSKGYSHLRLDGRTRSSRRQQLIHEFNTTSSLFVFLISTKAGGLGLNLTSANKVIMFDVNWNPSYDMQAQDRAFRIGQQRHVQVFRLVAQGTVEELCYMRQVYKLQLTKAAMAQTDQSTGPKHFEGVQGEEHGELFGVENLLQYMDGSILKAIRANAHEVTRNHQQDSEESQSSIQALMKQVVGKALDFVKSAPTETMDTMQSSDILEDPSALLAALGVLGTNMAAEEMLHDNHGPQSLDVLTHESDDERFEDDAGFASPGIDPVESEAAAAPPSSAPPVSTRPLEVHRRGLAEEHGNLLAGTRKQIEQRQTEAISSNAARKKRKLADVFVRGVRKHPPPQPTKKSARKQQTVKSKATSSSKPKRSRPVHVYIPNYAHGDK